MDPIKIKAFKNKYKKTENQPDFRGKYNGFEIAIWKQKDNDGETCLSVTVKEDTGEQSRPAKSTSRGGGRHDNLGVDEDDVPF